MQSAGSGQIVGIGSIAGDRGRRGIPAYSASKAGLHTYLEAMRNRLSRHGVTVTTIKLWQVQTAMLANADRVIQRQARSWQPASSGAQSATSGRLFMCRVAGPPPGLCCSIY
ncbi:hypothetical protein EMGBS3_14500, partial [Anaerolineaceae bacterium]